MCKISQTTIKYLLIVTVLIVTNVSFRLDAEAKTPKIRSAECRKLFSNYKRMPTYKAFALSANGKGCGWSNGYASKRDAINSAIGWCKKSRNKGCRIIANSNNPPAGYNKKPDGAGLLITIPGDADIRVAGDYAVKYSQATRKRTNQIPKYHGGIDFVRKNGSSEGLEIIAAAAGKVTRAEINKCSGGEIAVRSNLKKDGKYIHVGYSHLGKLSVRKGQKIKRGHVIGELSRGKKKWPCMGPTAHLHFYIRRLPAAGTYVGYLNPNRYWFDGGGKLACFDERINYDSTLLSLTSPLRCKPIQKPEFSGEIRELRAMLNSGDKNLVKKWQVYFRSLGIYAGKIDGIYGPVTEKSLSKLPDEFRKSKGLKSIDGLKECPNNPAQYYHDCIGTRTEENGNIYIGEWRNDKKHGQGIIAYSNGNKDAGTWLDGKFIKPNPKVQQVSRPNFDGEIHELRALFKNGDKEFIKKWQLYFRFLGIHTGDIDGIYNLVTRTALSKCGLMDKCWRGL